MNNTDDLPSSGQFQKIAILDNPPEETETYVKYYESQGEVIQKIKVKEGYVLLLKYPNIPDQAFFERFNIIN